MYNQERIDRDRARAQESLKELQAQHEAANQAFQTGDPSARSLMQQIETSMNAHRMSLDALNSIEKNLKPAPDAPSARSAEEQDRMIRLVMEEAIKAIKGE